MTSDEIRIMTERLVPVPRRIDFREGPVYQLGNGCRVRLCVVSPSGNEVKAMAALFQSYWQVMPDVVLELWPDAAGIGSEAYEIKVSETELSITAGDYAGLLNAMKTLRQLAEPNRGTERLSGYFLLQCEISDAPAMAFRGIHLCIFPETPLWDIEKQLRLAAYHKFNYAVIESWGIFPFESHPEFCWADRKLDKAALKRLVHLGKELGITLIPQFNLLGHATASRCITGKHAILDYNPALQPLFEPDGWTWCISNPAVRRILTDIVTELHEFYECPPFFHIGCDEADNIGTCLECRRHVLKELVREHITHFHDLMRKRGARVIMWHDMLLEKGDPRWKGYIVCGLPHHHLSQLYKELPHDIVIADWQYGYPVSESGVEPHWPTANFFNDEGFTTLVCPWLDEAGTVSLGRLAAEKRLFGMLETTWHISHDRNFSSIYGTAACSAWNPSAPRRTSIELRLCNALHLRQVGWDMKLTEYEKTGYSQFQVDAGQHPHQVN